MREDEAAGERREPTREEIDGSAGPVVLEFGATWCGHCRALAPGLTRLLADHPEVRHVRVEDGPGLPLGRSFGVKLWPTLVFLRNGKIVRQVSRPGLDQVREGLMLMTEAGLGRSDQAIS